MLIMWLTGLYCRWRQMDNSNWSLSVYCREIFSCSGTEKSSKLKCNGSTLGPMKLHGRWQIRCGLCILPYSLVEWMFWYVFLVHVLAMFGIVHMYMDVNTTRRYVIKIQWVVWVSCHYDFILVMLLCWFVSQQDDHCKYCNELSYKTPWAVCFAYNNLVGCRYCWTLRMVFPQGGGVCNSPSENSM